MAKNKKTTKIYTNLYVKRRLIQLEVDVFGMISKGVLAHKGRYAILSEVKRRIWIIAVQLGLDQREMDLIWAQIVATYNTVAQKTAVPLKKLKQNPDPEVKKEAIYTAIRPMIIQNQFLSDADKVTRLYEQRKKGDQIREMLSSAVDSPFFLCSAHPKPAKDHAEYQGRMYYDENWEETGNYSDQDKIAIRAYIRNHKLQTVQWVTGPPVYLVFRPNCKHYLTNIPLDEVLAASARSLLKKHGMIESDQLPASEQRLNYRMYYNRMKVEEELNKYVSCPKLKQDMIRDRKLIDKWK